MFRSGTPMSFPCPYRGQNRRSYRVLGEGIRELKFSAVETVIADTPVVVAHRLEWPGHEIYLRSPGRNKVGHFGGGGEGLQ